MGDIFGRGTKAGNRLFSRLENGYVKVEDPNVALYNKLRPEHFEALASRQGSEWTTEYIRRMEAQRIRNGH